MAHVHAVCSLAAIPAETALAATGATIPELASQSEDKTAKSHIPLATLIAKTTDLPAPLAEELRVAFGVEIPIHALMKILLCACPLTLAPTVLVTNFVAHVSRKQVAAGARTLTPNQDVNLPLKPHVPLPPLARPSAVSSILAPCAIKLADVPGVMRVAAIVLIPWAAAPTLLPLVLLFLSPNLLNASPSMADLSSAVCSW